MDQDQGLEPPLCAQDIKSSADSEIKIPKINRSRIATTYAIVVVVVLDREHEGPQQISQQGLFHPKWEQNTKEKMIFAVASAV